MEALRPMGHREGLTGQSDRHAEGLDEQVSSVLEQGSPNSHWPLPHSARCQYHATERSPREGRRLVRVPINQGGRRLHVRGVRVTRIEEGVKVNALVTALLPPAASMAKIRASVDSWR